MNRVYQIYQKVALSDPPARLAAGSWFSKSAYDWNVALMVDRVLTAG